jgi:EAL domain-containing protein (putative c-di-GMP-specific phosphodiesterase class I)
MYIAARHQLQIIDLLRFSLRQARHTNASLALVLVTFSGSGSAHDLDHKYQRQQVVKILVARIFSTLSSRDIGFQVSEDAFVIIFYRAGHRDKVSKLIDLLWKSLGQPVEAPDGKGITTPISLVVSTVPGCPVEDQGSPHALRADAVLVEMLAQCALYSCFPAWQDSEPALALSVREVGLAVRREQTDLRFCPRVAAATGNLTGLDVLFSAPLEPATGEDDLVIHDVFVQLRDWMKGGLKVVPVLVAVTARQLLDPHLAPRIALYAALYCVTPSMIELGLTEEVLAGNLQPAKAQSKALSVIGVRLLVRDYARLTVSLEQLAALGINKVEVCREIASHVSPGTAGLGRAAALISCARELNFMVRAAGVQDIAQLRMLRALGCEQFRGDLIAFPACAETASAWLNRTSMLAREFAE